MRLGERKIDILYKNKLERYQVPVYVIAPPTPERFKYDILQFA
jgi:hypothetical protein